MADSEGLQHQRKPLQLIGFEKGNLKWNSSTWDFLQSQIPEENEIAIIGIVGTPRAGKSLLANYIVEYLENHPNPGHNWLKTWENEDDPKYIDEISSGGSSFERFPVGTKGPIFNYSDPDFIPGIYVWLVESTIERGENPPLSVLVLDVHWSLKMNELRPNVYGPLIDFVFMASSPVLYVDTLAHWKSKESLELWIPEKSFVLKLGEKCFQACHYILRGWNEPKQYKFGSKYGQDFLNENKQKDSLFYEHAQQLTIFLQDQFQEFSFHLLPESNAEYSRILREKSKEFTKYFTSFVKTDLDVEKLNPGIGRWGANKGKILTVKNLEHFLKHPMNIVHIASYETSVDTPLPMDEDNEKGEENGTEIHPVFSKLNLDADSTQANPNNPQSNDSQQQQQTAANKRKRAAVQNKTSSESFQQSTRVLRSKASVSTNSSVKTLTTLQQPHVYINLSLMKVKMQSDYVPVRGAKLELTDSPSSYEIHAIHNEMDNETDNTNDENGVEKGNNVVKTPSSAFSSSCRGKSRKKNISKPRGKRNIVTQKRKCLKKFEKSTLKCAFCPHKTTTKSNLKFHMLVHQNDRPFKCTVSPYEFSFKRRADLKNHIQSQHTKERPFKCHKQDCTTTCKTMSQLNIHLQTHDPKKNYKCPEASCVYKTSVRQNLTKHGKLHLNDKRFQCPPCQFSSNQSGHLKKHLQTAKCKKVREILESISQHEKTTPGARNSDDVPVPNFRTMDVNEFIAFVESELGENFEQEMGFFGGFVRETLAGESAEEFKMILSSKFR